MFDIMAIFGVFQLTGKLDRKINTFFLTNAPGNMTILSSGDTKSLSYMLFFWQVNFLQKLSRCKQDIKCDLWLSKRFKNMYKSLAIQIWIIFECWPWLKPKVHLFDSKIIWEKERCCILAVFLQKWIISCFCKMFHHRY